MVGAHRADVNSLDTAYATVILHLNAREIPEGVGHAMAVEAFEFFAFELLYGYDFFFGPRCGYNEFFQHDRIGRRLFVIDS